MVTSAVPGDGKTLTATNLALTLSESYRRRVLLIDADLRRPSLHDDLQRAERVGPERGPQGRPRRQARRRRQITETLTLLPAGRPEPDPMGGLTSERMRRILEEAAAARSTG